MQQLNRDLGKSDLLRHNAERLIQTLWAAFNNSTLYGQSHPLAEQAVTAFERKILEDLNRVSPITFHMGDDAMHCEQWRLSKEGFATRLTARLRDMKVQSVTFHRGLVRSEIAAFLALLANPACSTVEAFESGLDKAGGRHIEPNFVTYQKVTKNDTIVRREVSEVLSALSDSVQRSSAEQGVPVTSNLVELLQGSDTTRELTMVERIRLLRDSMLTSKGNASQTDAIESLALARSTLHAALAQGDVNQEQRVESTAEFSNAMFDVVARIVNEEFALGKISARRLAQIVRKLLPGQDELRAFLPRLREVLLSQGLTLKEYGDVVTELAVEFEQEGALKALSVSAAKIGVSMPELLDGLREDPDAVVRLILLVREIGDNLDVGRTDSVALLDRFIEKVLPLEAHGLFKSTELTADARHSLLDSLEQDLTKEFLQTSPPSEEGAMGGDSGVEIANRVFDSVKKVLSTLLDDNYLPIQKPLEKEIRLLADVFVDKLELESQELKSPAFQEKIWRLQERVLALLEEIGAEGTVLGRVQAGLGVAVEELFDRELDRKLAEQQLGDALGEVDIKHRDAAREELLELANVLSQGRGTGTEVIDGYDREPKAAPGATLGVADKNNGGAGALDRNAVGQGACLPGAIAEDGAGGELLVHLVVKPKVRKPRPNLPAGVIKMSEIRRKLTEEIARNKRYSTPLTSITVSFLGVVRNGQVIEPSDEVLQKQVNAVCENLNEMLRELDCVGVLGAVGGFFQLTVLLGMTPAPGAAIVKGRIGDRLKQMEFDDGAGLCKPAIAVSLLEYDAGSMGDPATFIRKMKAQHRRIVRKTFGALEPDTAEMS